MEIINYTGALLKLIEDVKGRLNNFWLGVGDNMLRDQDFMEYVLLLSQELFNSYTRQFDVDIGLGFITRDFYIVLPKNTKRFSKYRNVRVYISTGFASCNSLKDVINFNGHHNTLVVIDENGVKEIFDNLSRYELGLVYLDLLRSLTYLLLGGFYESK